MISMRFAKPSGYAVKAAGGGTIVATGRGIPESIIRNEDAVLVAGARNGDVNAFGELVNRYQRVVYGVVSRMVDNRDDVDDIVQEVFVLVYKSIASFRGDSEFSTWIYRIAVNTTIKTAKKLKLRQASSIDDPAVGLTDTLTSSERERPERIAERGARDEALRKAIEKLPEKHRATVVLHYFENRSCSQIAEVMSCSVGTVWSRLHYACKKLEQELKWLGSEA
jgi:RNA polymerase sigma-70 factor, ECF subfamily